MPLERTFRLAGGRVCRLIRIRGELIPDYHVLAFPRSQGDSARREKGWHVHIVLLGNRWRKSWLYAVLAGKNLLQAFGLRRDDAPGGPR